VAPVEGLAEILFPTGLPALPMGFSTVMTDSFTHRTYVGGVMGMVVAGGGRLEEPGFLRN